MYMSLICCSWLYAFFYVSSGELIFEPGVREAIIAVNILDDTVPEEEESFRVQLKNPKGGAEIGINGYVKITILSNDDAYGVVGFAQVMIPKIPHLEFRIMYSLHLYIVDISTQWVVLEYFKPLFFPFACFTPYCAF